MCTGTLDDGTFEPCERAILLAEIQAHLDDIDPHEVTAVYLSGVLSALVRDREIERAIAAAKQLTGGGI